MRREWSLQEIIYLQENYKGYNLQEISKELGRVKTSVCRKAKQLGIEMTGRKTENPTGYRDDNRVWHKKDWVRKTDEEIAATRSKIMKEWHSTHEHPKGMLGKHHSEEVCKKTSIRVKNDWNNLNSTYNTIEFRQRKSDYMHNYQMNNKNSNAYSRTKSGKRADLNNQYFRSSWEANYARYLNFLINKGEIYKWEYEPDVFDFEEIKRGTRSYIPDFKIWEKENSKPYYVELKGWMDKKSQTKLNRFKKYYPEEYNNMKLIQLREYNQIKKIAPFIKGWE